MLLQPLVLDDLLCMMVASYTQGDYSEENEHEDDIETYIDRMGRVPCISCDKGGKMLVCSVSDCPVAIHQKCLPSKPRFNDKGNFLCPYCLYKHEVTRALDLRKKLILTKKALSDFEGVNSDQQKPNDEGNGMDVDEISVEAGAGPEIGRDDVILASNDQDRNVVEHQSDTLAPVGGHREKVNSIDPPKDSRRKETPNEVKTLESPEFVNVVHGNRREEEALQRNDDSHCVNEEKAVCVPLSASTEGTFMSEKCKGNQGRMEEEEEEHAHPEVAGTEAPAHDSELSEASNSDTVAPLVRRTRAKPMKTGFKVDLSKKSSSQPQRTSEKDAGNQKNKEISPKRTGKASEPSKPVDLVTFWIQKPKKLFWTAEEENMLKEGVLKYSTLVNKNLPWRKILVFGGHVFHSTRTQSDLKDKWKNIMKEKARTGQCHE
ncbi:hypothetical protein HS088_TW21G00015 [Tripterygium wilfordii]|uniref:Myb-like domain-containing protein n=1 Tax=Tripterygium wilfordii TaxID=458696 RepID=A0A7J7C278_TRIWF|nr:hypothetical protein HS088_TW21G00015 [Tripterygium wilfordii]